MAKVTRVKPEAARRKLDSGEAILVCAYDSDEKFQQMHLKGAISLNRFKERLPDLPREQEIIFYCG